MRSHTGQGTECVVSYRAQTGESLEGRQDAVVLVASSAGMEEAAELVDIAVRLFDENDAIRVVIK